MANTFTLISSTVLGANASIVNFSSIPSNFDDLSMFCNIRSTFTSSTKDTLFITVNDRASFNDYSYNIVSYSNTGSLYGVKNRLQNGFLFQSDLVPTPSSSTNVYSSMEIYLPRYKEANTVRGLSAHFALATNTTNLNAGGLFFGNWLGTSAINKISFQVNNGEIGSGSSFYLYGISNT